MTEKTAVHTPTKEEYDRLMKAYEKKGWEYRKIDWFKFGKNTTITFEKIWGYCYLDYYKQSYTIITVDKAIAKLGLYERGQEVLVSNDNIDWIKKIYLTTIEGAYMPYIVVMDGNGTKFIEGKTFIHSAWKFIKPLEPTTTLEENKQQVIKYIKAIAGCIEASARITCTDMSGEIEKRYKELDKALQEYVVRPTEKP